MLNSHQPGRRRQYPFSSLLVCCRIKQSPDGHLISTLYQIVLFYRFLGNQPDFLKAGRKITRLYFSQYKFKPTLPNVRPWLYDFTFFSLSSYALTQIQAPEIFQQSGRCRSKLDLFLTQKALSRVKNKTTCFLNRVSTQTPQGSRPLSINFRPRGWLRWVATDRPSY